MAKLETKFLGLTLKSPLVAGASPLSRKLDSVKKLEDEGVGALVMYSLFEEEVVHESLELNHFLNQGTESQPEAQTYLVEPETYADGAMKYLEQLQKIKAAVEIPVIASLNGTTRGGWVRFASDLEATGADALELNLYDVITDPEVSADQVEKRYISLVREVLRTVNIPVTIKLSPYFVALPHFVRRVEKAGVSGFVLFNRFLQPDFDIEALDVDRKVRFSTSADLALPARWAAILAPMVKADLVVSGGVHTGRDMVKAIMAGANAVQVVSELVQKGTERAGALLKELEKWMDINGYASVEDMRGALSLAKTDNPGAFERANYVSNLRTYNTSIR